jgi:catechol 2,3-dioxygenase-like lactoylglutathione lyase family enzyme
LPPSSRWPTPSWPKASRDAQTTARINGARLIGIAIDCAEAEPVARFYEQLLGYEVLELGTRWSQLQDPATGFHLNIQAEDWYEPPTWPEEPDSLTKMLHLEVEVDDVERAVQIALEAGGTQAPWQPLDLNPQRIRIMLDPAGHPVCLFVHGE